MKEEIYHPQSPAFGDTFRYIALSCAEDDIQPLVDGCRDYLSRLHRWRWLRRYHVERQLAVMELALVSYTYGMRKGGKR